MTGGKFPPTDGFRSWQFFESEEKIKLTKSISVSQTMQIRHTSLLRWPFAVTSHAKQQSLDWYPRVKNLFIGWMTKVLAGTFNLAWVLGIYKWRRCSVMRGGSAGRVCTTCLWKSCNNTMELMSFVPFLSKIDDSGVKNKWRWAWAAEKDRLGWPIKSWIRKCEWPGQARTKRSKAAEKVQLD